MGCCVTWITVVKAAGAEDSAYIYVDLHHIDDSQMPTPGSTITLQVCLVTTFCLVHNRRKHELSAEPGHKCPQDAAARWHHSVRKV